MFNSIDLLIRYHLETEWLLTWFPNKAGQILNTAKSRGGAFNHINTDIGPGLGSDTGVVHTLGEGLGPDANGDALDENNHLAHAFITILVDVSQPARFFKAELEVGLGSIRRKKSMTLLPNTITPFMINVQGSKHDSTFRDTTLVLQGVFNADPTIDLFTLATRDEKP